MVDNKEMLIEKLDPLSQPDKDFDEITNLANSVSKTPLVFIGLMGDGKFGVKAKLGLDFDEAPSAKAFCEQVVHGKQVFVVPDTWKDPQFADNPLVVGAPFIRSYVGFPVLSQNKICLGALSIVDTKPHVSFDEAEMECLKALAQQIGLLLDLKKFKAELSASELKISELSQTLEKSLESVQQYQQALKHSSKMSSLGEMTSAITHEINNPLAVISSYNEHLEILAESGQADMAAVLDITRKVQTTLKRIARIVKGLRKFSREVGDEPFELVSVSQIVNDAVEICSPLFKKNNVLLKMSPIPENIKILCHETEICQVLVNLLSNSEQAVAELKDRWIQVEVAENRGYISIKVRDSGKGIPESIRPHIMEPFFTSKPAGKGTGLGLSISLDLVVKHKGKLYLDSNDTHTCFVVEIPTLQS